MALCTSAISVFESLNRFVPHTFRRSTTADENNACYIPNKYSDAKNYRNETHLIRGGYDI